MSATGDALAVLVVEDSAADARLRRIPVIVLTSAYDADSVDRSYELQASAFVTKPSGLEGYRALLDAFEAFWLRTARLPGPARTA